MDWGAIHVQNLLVDFLLLICLNFCAGKTQNLRETIFTPHSPLRLKQPSSEYRTNFRRSKKKVRDEMDCLPVAQGLRIKLSMQRHRFDLWSGKIPHVLGQVSQHTSIFIPLYSLRAASEKPPVSLGTQLESGSARPELENSQCAKTTKTQHTPFTYK